MFSYKFTISNKILNTFIPKRRHTCLSTTYHKISNDRKLLHFNSLYEYIIEALVLETFFIWHTVFAEYPNSNVNRCISEVWNFGKSYVIHMVMEYFKLIHNILLFGNLTMNTAELWDHATQLCTLSKYTGNGFFTGGTGDGGRFSIHSHEQWRKLHVSKVWKTTVAP